MESVLNKESESTTSMTRELFNKVPAVTVVFWLIKVLCTTVGETAADFLNVNLHFGLVGTTWFMGALLVGALVIQFRSKQYSPLNYWLVVVFLSIFGTLITDNLSDRLHVPLIATTIAFSLALIATFAVWYKNEKTLSIHTIYTFKRETFYWLAILFTFALGTAAGDLLAEKANLGYFTSLLLFAGAIGLVAVAYFGFKASEILTFWIAYILTRPLGATFGDLLSQPKKLGGFGLGTVGTSAIFLTAITALVIYLAVTKSDELAPKPQPAIEENA